MDSTECDCCMCYNLLHIEGAAAAAVAAVLVDGALEAIIITLLFIISRFLVPQ